MTNLQDGNPGPMLDLCETDLSQNEDVHLGGKFVHVAMHQFIVLLDLAFLQKGEGFFVHGNLDADVHAQFCGGNLKLAFGRRRTSGNGGDDAQTPAFAHGFVGHGFVNVEHRN